MTGTSLLVLGASSDMGMALIQSVHKNYALIIAHYNHMNETLAALQSQLGETLLCIQADLSQEAHVHAFVAQVKDCGVAPSHIVHFPAPQSENQRFHNIPWQTFQNDLDVSVRSLVLVLQSFLPGMAKRKYGRVIVMLSYTVNGLPPAHCSDYIVTKYALLGLMKTLAVEYAGKGITVNGVSPAFVMTKFLSKQPDFIIEKNAAESPIGRNLTASDIVPTLQYLLSDGAACVNGENIAITCGRRA